MPVNVDVHVIAALQARRAVARRSARTTPSRDEQRDDELQRSERLVARAALVASERDAADA